MAKRFDELTEREILALAISQEEEDGRIYGEFAEGLRETYPATAKLMREMLDEESEHRASLIELYRSRFGEHIPLIRRQDVKGAMARTPVWMVQPLGVDYVRRQIKIMETEARRFYLAAAQRVTDAQTRKLLGDLAEAEVGHLSSADTIEREHVASGARANEDAQVRRTFVLQVVQPGLAGLMDGSVSTLAPLFAAAFATQNSWQAFLVGLAASVGAGISMGFAEALSDDGTITGRGSPMARGIVCGAMTTAGGIGHTLPFLIPDVHLATRVAIIVVLIELGVISWIRQRYMETPFVRAALQVVLGGLLVFAAGVLIGRS
jgi:rubrerythrin